MTRTLMKNLVVVLLCVDMVCAQASMPLDTPSCQPTGTQIGFTNGIQNERWEARGSLEALYSLAEAQRLPVAGTQLFYHTKGRPGHETGKESMKLDILEVYWQLAQASVGNDPAKEQQAIALFHHAITAPSSGYSLANFGGWLLQAENDAEAQAFQAQTAANVQLETQTDVGLLLQILSRGDRLMMAAHSQGTLWANSALQRLASLYPRYAKQVHLVNAGMAASHVWQTPGSAYANPYVTNQQDHVINQLRNLAQLKGLPVPAPANSDAGLMASGLSGHSFVDVYLKQDYEPGQLFAKTFSNGFKQVTSENPTNPTLVAFDVDMNVGLAGQAALTSGAWVPDQTPDTLTGPTGELMAWGQYLRTGPQTFRVSQNVYCGYLGSGGADVAPVDIPLYVSMPNNLPRPTISGTLTFNGVTTPVAIANRVISDNGFLDYAFAHVAVSRVNGVVQAKVASY